MREKPKKRDERIVNAYMWSSIATGSICCFALSMFFLLSDCVKTIFRPDATNKYVLTGYFSFFIFTAVFNAFNARTDCKNIFDNIANNKNFLYIISTIVCIQIMMTYYGGVILRCYGLNALEWIFVLCLSVMSIPVDIIRKMALSCPHSGKAG
jgi:magnesium-transporting ATPase (P-type)